MSEKHSGLKNPLSKDPAAVSLGRRGGKVGGPARARKLTARQRYLIGLKAARARWDKEKSSPHS